MRTYYSITYTTYDPDRHIAIERQTSIVHRRHDLSSASLSWMIAVRSDMPLQQNDIDITRIETALLD